MLYLLKDSGTTYLPWRSPWCSSCSGTTFVSWWSPCCTSWRSSGTTCLSWRRPWYTSWRSSGTTCLSWRSPWCTSWRSSETTCLWSWRKYLDCPSWRSIVLVLTASCTKHTTQWKYNTSWLITKPGHIFFIYFSYVLRVRGILYVTMIKKSGFWGLTV